MNYLLRYLILFVLATSLAACATVGRNGVTEERDYFPGGSTNYAWGGSQSKEHFANVERAQYEYSPYTAQRHWIDMQTSSKASATMIGLYAYYPLHVRWKLKDGREFILENIDLRAIMREYFKTNDIKLQWQREGRTKAKSGDYVPLLAHEIKDDAVRIKWIIMINHTPVNQRFTPKGAATDWVVIDEPHVVATLRGVPTSGIDFNKKWEFKTSASQQARE